ncbi:MAG: hypothetical protein WCA21_05435 [Terracidiphilus sp.]
MAFNEGHILAITQAICDYRKAQKIDGPLFLGMDIRAESSAPRRHWCTVLPRQPPGAAQDASGPTSSRLLCSRRRVRRVRPPSLRRPGKSA